MLLTPSLKKPSHLPSLLSRLLLILPHPQSRSSAQVGARREGAASGGGPPSSGPSGSSRRSARSASAPLPPGSRARPHRPRPGARLAARPLLPKLPSQRRVSPYPDGGRRQARQQRFSRDSGLRSARSAGKFGAKRTHRGVGGPYGSGSRPPRSEPRLPTRNA